MTYRYGDPVGTKTAERPKCWGKEYNSEDRECKGCTWQASCRDEIIRSQVNRQPVAPQPVQAPMNYYQPQPYVAPQPVPVAFQPPKPVQVATPAPQPQYQVTRYQPPSQVVPAQAVPVPLPSPMPVQNPMQMSALDWYGRFQDPLHFALMTAPPPYRPQLPGESFFERVVKNVGLAMLEAVAMQGLLAVRQMVIPPQPGNTIDVTAEKR